MNKITTLFVNDTVNDTANNLVITNQELRITKSDNWDYYTKIRNS